MRAAGVRYGVAEASGATGLLQYSDGRPANRCAGVMRVSMVPDTDGEFDAQMLMHELVHAACRVYRLTETNDGPVHLGWSPGTAEEAFAHIYDELWNSFQAAWVRGDPEGWEVKVDTDG